jgi:outer membrane protein assembly factor BamA
LVTVVDTKLLTRIWNTPRQNLGQFIFALLFVGMTWPILATTTLIVEGNRIYAKKKIEGAISVPEKPLSFSANDWEVWSDEVTASLSDLYSEDGYFDASFHIAPLSDSGLAVLGVDANFQIRVQVDEGRRYSFGSVTIRNTDHSAVLFDASKLRSRMGRAFAKDIIFRDRREVLSAYGDAGFLHCKSTEKLTSDTLAKVINLEFLVESGPSVVFDTLILRNFREADSTGTRGITQERLLRSLLGLRRGDTVSLNTTASFEKKLKSTRVFNFVRLRDSLLADGNNQSAMILSTEERLPGEMTASLFYETQYGIGTSVDWFHGNIWGQLHEGRFGSSFAQRKQSLYTGYASPLFFGTSFRFDNDLITNWYQDSRLNLNASAFEGDFDITNSSKLSKAFTPWLRGVESAELTGRSESLDTMGRDREFNINIIHSAFFSFLDDVVNTTRGMRFSLTWGNGGSFFDKGQILSTGQLKAPVGRRHNWLEVESGFYYPVLERLLLAFRLNGGRFFGEGGINSERFFLGGPRSVRSFGWRKVCPEKDSVTGICIKDGIEPAYYLGSLELRTSPFSPAFINTEGHWRYLLGLQVVPFVDYGDVWDQGKAAKDSGKGRAYGLGLRYSLLSIFNIRLDYAIDGWARTNSQWVIDLAQAF